MSRPCSIHVYQVTLMSHSWAISSRRSPGVRRRPPEGRPTISGWMRARALRRKSPNALRRAARPCTFSPLAQHAGQGAANVVFVAPAALNVIVHLVLANIADPKILRGRVAEIEARHAGRRVHGVTLGQLHANVFALHDTEHVLFHDMLGAGRITGCRTNALVLLGNQGFVVQFFIGRISPQVASYTGMHAFGKPFGESVGQGLKHNAGVVVARIQEGLVMLLDANAPGNGEHADVISHTAGLGCNVVGQTFVIHTLPLLLLLTQVAPREQYFGARF